MEKINSEVLQIRLSKSMMKILDKKVKRLKKQMPEYRVTRSSVARMAMEDFLNNTQKKRQ